MVKGIFFSRSSFSAICKEEAVVKTLQGHLAGYCSTQHMLEIRKFEETKALWCLLRSQGNN